MDIRPPCAPPILRIRKLQRPKKMTPGTTHDASSVSQVFSAVPVNRTFAASSSWTSWGSSTRVVTKRWSPLPASRSSATFSFGKNVSSPFAASVPSMACLDSVRSLTLPALRSLMKSLYASVSGRDANRYDSTTRIAMIVTMVYPIENRRCFDSIAPFSTYGHDGWLEGDRMLEDVIDGGTQRVFEFGVIATGDRDRGGDLDDVRRHQRRPRGKADDDQRRQQGLQHCAAHECPRIDVAMVRSPSGCDRLIP